MAHPRGRHRRRPGVIPAAVFRDQEDAAGYFTVLASTARHVGLPLALYTDRHGIFTKDPDRPPTLTEQLTGKRSLTCGISRYSLAQSSRNPLVGSVVRFSASRLLPLVAAVR